MGKDITPVTVISKKECKKISYYYAGCTCGLSQMHAPTLPFLSVLVSISVFMALSTDTSLSHSVLQVLFLLFGPFNYISLYEGLIQT